MKTMNYENKYKEALKAVKELSDSLDESYLTEELEKIFPELKESEGERIRKYLLKLADRCPEDSIDFMGEVKKEDVIAWLEKHGEYSTLPKWKYKKDRTPLLRDSLILNKYGCVAKSPSGANVSDVWVIDYAELAKLPKEELEKQGEQKQGKTILDGINVEPKFRVGDWVVTSYGKANQVVSVDKDGDGFTLDDDTYFSGSWCDMYHFWTIGDAKAGDVLVDNYGNICIYQEPSTKLMYHSYCYGNNEYFIDSGGSHAIVGTYPATKEQRDLLFQKMKEAGYMWDAEKKELKEIEQKSAWSEEDEEELEIIIDFLNNPSTAELCPTLRGNTIDWLKSLKERVQPQNNTITSDELAQAKKEAYNDALDKIEYHSGVPSFDDGWSAAIWYIKKKNIGFKNTWTPSEEQIATFWDAICNLNHDGYKWIDDLKSLFQDLKKLSSE